MTSMESKIKPIMDKYGIPYNIWSAIMQQESSGNPTSKQITSREYSVGLFQINKMAHPEYSGLDLENPLINAEIAARDFIAPGYATAKTITQDTKQQALITYSGLKNPEKTSGITSSDYISGGIKPQWTQSLKDSFTKIFNTKSLTPEQLEKLRGISESLPITGTKPNTSLEFEMKDLEGGITGQPQDYSSIELKGFQPWVKTVVIFIVIIIMVIISFQILKNNGMDVVKKITKE
jgi:hypothetical protein